MAIQYVGGQTAGRTNASSALQVTFSLTGGLASTPAADDLVIVTVCAGTANGDPALAITTPTGYTGLTHLLQNATADCAFDVSYKKMGSTPDTTVTIPGTTNNAWGEAYAIQVFRGVDTTTPLDVTPTNIGGMAWGQPNPNSITPVTAGAWVVVCGGAAASAGAVFTAPTNYGTDFISSNGSDTTDAMVGMGYWDGWTSGAEDPGFFGGGTTGSGDSWNSYTIALRPASSQVTHAATGALTNSGGALAGTASSSTTRPSTGALTGPGGTLSGTAVHNKPHPTSGSLSGPGGVLAGTAVHTTTHASSGALSGPGGALTGAAARLIEHTSTGALTNPGASLAGTASSSTARPSSGALQAPGAVLVGAATHFRTHPSVATLAGSGALLTGSAARSGAAPPPPPKKLYWSILFMNISPFAPSGAVTTVNATTSGGTNRQALSGAGGKSMTIRVCNKGTVAAKVAFGDSTVNAATDTRALTVLSTSERVFTLPDGITHVDAVADSTTADVTFQIGTGV